MYGARAWELTSFLFHWGLHPGMERGTGWVGGIIERSSSILSGPGSLSREPSTKDLKDFASPACEADCGRWLGRW